MTRYNRLRLFLCGLVVFFLFLVVPHHLSGEWNLETIGLGTHGKVAVDSTGKIHVCYLSEPVEGDVIYGVRTNDQWSIETLTNSGQVFQVALATDTAGAAHIIYAEADWYHGTFTLQYLNNSGNGWSSPETIASNDRGFWSLSIGIDGDNHIHTSYLKASSMASSSSIYYLTNKSGTWKSYTLNDEYQNPAYDHIAMAVDPDGYVYFVSYFFRIGGPGYITNAPNGQWIGPQLIQSNWTGGQMEGMIIDLALDPNNNPHVSYVGSDNGENLENHRYATITGPNKLWTSQQIDDGSWFSAGHAIASDPDGVIHSAYIHYATGELRYTMNYSGSWPHETIDTPGANFDRNVDMVTDQNGFVHIIYEDDDNVLYATNRVEIPAPNIVLSPTELAFGTIDTGKVSTKLVQVKNEGVLDLHISDVRLTGGDSAEFSLEHLCDTIIPDDSCAVQVTFKPGIIGEKRTTLAISSDDPDTPVISATLTGRTPYPVISVDLASLEFDPTEVGESDTLTLTIENTGDAELTIDSLRISGDGADAFSYSSFCGTITQATGCVLEVMFNPAEVG
ncbi:MAG: choice-of-anchor D domain-containing protein, partial [Calditrichota bacterium]